MKLAAKMKKTIAMLTLAAMIPTMSVTVMAKDYDNHWAKNVITEWSQYGIVEGYKDGSFKPNNNVTKAELAAFITRVFGLTDTKTSVKYSDVATDAWYADAIAKVTAAGIMTETNGKFSPNTPATREETAAALAIAYNLTNSSTTSFADDAQISEWAKAGVSALASKGYIEGRPDGKFDPKANLTRAEFITMIDKLTESFANKAGTYTGDKNGNVLVNTKDVVLENMTINGNLYLAQGIGTGDVTLKKVTVKGQTFIAGGGVNSIKMYECVMPNGAIITSTNPVRVVSEGGKISIKAEEGTQIILTGSFDKIEVPADVKVELKAATVAQITIVPSVKNPTAKSEIKTDAASAITKVVANAPVAVTGTAKIAQLEANVAGVSTQVTPTQIDTKPGVDAPTTGGAAAGGGGGGGGTSEPTDAKKLTKVVVSLSNGTTQEYPITNGVVEFDLPAIIEKNNNNGNVRIQNISIQGDAGYLSVAGTTDRLQTGIDYTLQNIITIVTDDLDAKKNLLVDKLSTETATKINTLYNDAKARLVDNTDVSIQAVIDEYNTLSEKAENNHFGYLIPDEYTKTGTFAPTTGDSSSATVKITFK